MTTAQLEDFIGLMRRLWRGEKVVDHDGPAGRWPALTLDPTFHEDIPIALTAFGPQTLALAGRAADAVVLHTFFTDETTARCVRTGARGGRAGGPRPGVGGGVVLLRDGARPPPRGGPPEADRGPPSSTWASTA